jgi:uncharacterized protein YndB with AHSA1/START domain
MAIIYHQVLISAVRSRIYDAITTQEGISEWWTADCLVKPVVGFINEFRIDPQTHYRMKVVHLQPGLSVEWKCVNQHDDWSGTQLSFHLVDKGPETLLDFKHTGFTTENEEYAISNFRWAKYLMMLRDFCEKSGPQTSASAFNAPILAVQAGMH